MSKNEFAVQDEDWAKNLEQGVEAYTDSLLETLWSEENDEVISTLSGEPFCGCSQCFWRETLFYLVPKIIKGYEEGKVTLEK